MLRSLYAGVSGLKVHQTKMDVIGNNIANVNTIGFKASSVNFKEMLNQTIQSASAPAQDGSRGGINPQQVGLGVGIGSIDVDFTQGNLQSTGKTADLAIDGNGFLVLNNGNQDLYTRAGALTLDDNGNLVSSANGLKVQGWEADASGKVNTNNTIKDVVIPIGSSMNAQATSNVSFGKNLDGNVPNYVDATTTPDSKRTATIDVVDSLGAKHTVSVEFTRNTTADPSATPATTSDWSWQVTGVQGADPTTVSGSGTLSFDTHGNLTSGGTDTFAFTPTDGADAQTVNIDFNEMTQAVSEYTVDGLDSDGYSKGELKNYSINDAGIITGSYSNGLTKTIGQLAVANFNNPAGLTKQGESLFTSSPNSGLAQVGIANNGGRGKIASGKLEMSNVDLAEQFTEMITTQRGFQANSKVITTGDQMLQDLVSLKR